MFILLKRAVVIRPRINSSLSCHGCHNSRPRDYICTNTAITNPFLSMVIISNPPNVINTILPFVIAFYERGLCLTMALYRLIMDPNMLQESTKLYSLHAYKTKSLFYTFHCPLCIMMGDIYLLDVLPFHGSR